MVISAVEDAKSKEAQEQAESELRQATEGLSRTVFPQDMKFLLKGTAKLTETKSVFTNTAFANVFVVPEDSPYFCKWQATHTPNLVGVGQVFHVQNLPSSQETQELMFAQGVQAILFQDPHGPGIGEKSFFDELANPILLDRRRRTLEEYGNSYFILDLTGDLIDVEHAELTLKGTPVPFIVQKSGKGWLGITVFRPQWERLCRARTGGASTHSNPRQQLKK
jgi:hypothetical protein